MRSTALRLAAGSRSRGRCCAGATAAAGRGRARRRRPSCPGRPGNAQRPEVGGVRANALPLVTAGRQWRRKV
eukprot:1602132-Alexandrium_andersonii.AAC.1